MINRHLSKTRYLLTSISWAQVYSSSRSRVFKLTADQVLVFDWIAGSCQVNLLKNRAPGIDCDCSTMHDEKAQKTGEIIFSATQNLTCIASCRNSCVILVTLHVNWKITSFSISQFVILLKVL